MRSAALGVTAAVAVLVPAAAQAQAILHDEDAFPTLENDFRSEQHWALEFRLGPYVPGIDSEFTGPAESRPHRRYFGTKRRVMAQLEVDYQFFHAFGSAAIGLQLGYFRETASAVAESTGQASADTTALSLWPITLCLVYRMDVLATRWQIPIVPYVKLGLSDTIWSITDANDGISTPGAGGRGRGATPGWMAAGGIALLLDWIDPQSTRAMDSETGLNHIYVFIEADRFDASGLGRKKALHVGDTTWVAGLLFEF
jgi:hypothetical protein